MAHQYIPKIFYGPQKNPPAPPPTYLMYGPLSALISSAKSEYDGREMFSSFIQYEWSSDAKGVADQL